MTSYLEIVNMVGEIVGGKRLLNSRVATIAVMAMARTVLKQQVVKKMYLTSLRVMVRLSMMDILV